MGFGEKLSVRSNDVATSLARYQRWPWKRPRGYATFGARPNMWCSKMVAASALWLFTKSAHIFTTLMPRGIPLRSCSFATCQDAPAPLPFWIFFLGNHLFVDQIMMEWQDSTMKIMSHIDLQNLWIFHFFPWFFMFFHVFSWFLMIFHDFSWNGKAGKAPPPILWMALWQRHLHSVWCASHHSWKRWYPLEGCPMWVCYWKSWVIHGIFSWLFHWGYGYLTYYPTIYCWLYGYPTENVGLIFPNELAIFHRDNDQQNHWVKRGTQHF